MCAVTHSTCDRQLVYDVRYQRRFECGPHICRCTKHAENYEYGSRFPVFSFYSISIDFTHICRGILLALGTKTASNDTRMKQKAQQSDTPVGIRWTQYCVIFFRAPGENCSILVGSNPHRKWDQRNVYTTTEWNHSTMLIWKIQHKKMMKIFNVFYKICTLFSYVLL